MMRALFLAFGLSLASGAALAASCQRVGDMVYCNDGSRCQIVGGQMYCY